MEVKACEKNGQKEKGRKKQRQELTGTAASSVGFKTETSPFDPFFILED